MVFTFWYPDQYSDGRIGSSLWLYKFYGHISNRHIWQSPLICVAAINSSMHTTNTHTQLRHCVYTYPEEPEDVILFFTNSRSISVARDSVAKQPEAKNASKYVNVFLEGRMTYTAYAYSNIALVSPTIGLGQSVLTRASNNN